MILSLLGLIGTILLYFLLTLLFLILLVLMIPIQYRISGFRDEDEILVEAAASWFFRMITASFSVDTEFHTSVKVLVLGRFSLRALAARKAKREQAIAQKQPDKNKLEKKKQSKRKFVMTMDKGKRIARSVLRILKCMAPGMLMVDGRIGFEDPATTGYLCAILSPLKSFIQKNPRDYQVHIVPVFEASELSGMFRIEGRIIIWFIVWEALKLAISKPFRQDIFGRKKPKAKHFIGGFEHVRF